MKTEFYKMEYEAWDEGTELLTLEQEAAYLRVCHMMYRRRGPVLANPLALSRLWRCHPNKARKILDDLVSTGKVILVDGYLTNTRVTQELDARKTRSTQAADAGETGGRRAQDNRRKSLENNNVGQATAQAKVLPPQPEKRREEEIEVGDRPLPNGGVARSTFPPNAFRVFWTRYPNKVGERAAEAAFREVVESDTVGFTDLMFGLERYCLSKPLARKWCNPATFLREGRWTDDPAADPEQIRSGNGFSDVAARKVNGDGSAYRDSWAHLDQPDHTTGNRSSSGSSSSGEAGRRGGVLSIDRARALRA